MAYRTYQQSATAPFDAENLRITVEATVSRGLRTKITQFGDGYNQTQTDGLNNQLERWSIRTAPMSENEAWGLESWLMRSKGAPFQWTPPDSTKTFRAYMSGSRLELGYRNLATVALSGYANPTNYTANLTTGIITSVNIPSGTSVTVSLTLAPRWYQLQGDWSITDLGSQQYVISFELKRVYV